MAKPWERLDDETDAPWRVFEVFLAMPAPRSLEGLVPLTAHLHATGYAYETLKGWSHDWLWFPRARAFDEHLARRARRAQERATESVAAEMARRHARAAKRLLALAERGIASLEKRDKNGATLTPADVERMVKTGIVLERLVRGDATERVETRVDLSKLTLEQLWEQKKINKLTGKE